ncbi:Calpain-5 [Nymphon striatum]|nr:Calpain-5 [Nymphon striatum]
MGLFKEATCFKNQNYEELRKKCEESNEKFIDPEFPAESSSLYTSSSKGSKSNEIVEWKRPTELENNPKLFVDGASSCDVKQGALGNCWLVAACSSLAQEKELWRKTKIILILMKKQKSLVFILVYFTSDFGGLENGLMLLVDDQLPTQNGKLIYIHSQAKNEFWGALLEKAYAKVSGSYEVLEGGNLSDALVDFTGGISENIEFAPEGYATDEEKRKTLFKNMLEEMDAHSLMCGAISAASPEEMEARTDVGLVKGHAYGITAVKKVHIGESGLVSLFTGRKKIYMVRLRNPWGEKEWNGPFSDGWLYSTAKLTKLLSSSPEWSKIDESEREKMGLTFEEDGEFWMTFDDFVKYFTEISICHLPKTSWFSFGTTWKEEIFHGKWIAGPKGSETDLAGGCPNNKDSFIRNPQFRFDIDEENETVMFYLIQKDKRAQKNEGNKNLVIGMHIMVVEVNRRYRLHTMAEKAVTSDYVRTRAVFFKTTLPRGRYVIVPSTFEPGETGDYMLRIFTSGNANAKKLTENVPKHSMWACASYPSVVTKITVRAATGLEKQDHIGGADPYCIIKCEGEKVRTFTVKNNLNPAWNTSAIFFRKNSNSPIKVQIWNSNVVMDAYMGKGVFIAPVNNQPVIHEADLFGRRREKGLKRPGKIIVEINTCDDLNSF